MTYEKPMIDEKYLIKIQWFEVWMDSTKVKNKTKYSKRNNKLSKCLVLLSETEKTNSAKTQITNGCSTTPSVAIIESQSFPFCYLTASSHGIRWYAHSWRHFWCCVVYCVLYFFFFFFTLMSLFHISFPFSILSFNNRTLHAHKVNAWVWYVIVCFVICTCTSVCVVHVCIININEK